LIRDGDALLNELRAKAKSSSALKEKLAEAERDYYGLDRILHWNRFGTVDKLMAHNRAVLKKLSGLAGTGK